METNTTELTLYAPSADAYAYDTRTEGAVGCEHPTALRYTQSIPSTAQRCRCGAYLPRNQRVVAQERRVAEDQHLIDAELARRNAW